MQSKVPSAITNITLNRATFSNVPINELTFVNFFYGNNGAGKSSIAYAIEEDDGVVWGDGKSAADFDVLAYNQNFINNNFANYGDLKGVFIFGEEDIEAKEKVDKLSDEKRQKSEARLAALDEYKKKTEGIESALTQFQDTCFTKTATIRKRFDKCMDGKKQKKNFAEAIIKEANPIDHDLAELERLYDVAFDDSARAYSEFKKAAATTYGSLPGKDLLDRMIVSSSDTPFAKFMKALGDTASDWVRDGHTHYAGAAGGKCPYCQQKLPANFEDEIAATFDAQYQQDVRDLGQFQAIYARETAEIVRVLQANTNEVMPTIDLKAYQEKIALLESNFEINRQRIAEKVKEPSKKVSLEDTDTLLLEIGALIDDINKIIKAADISRGSFYTYFEDKEDLARYMLGGIREKFKQAVFHWMDAEKGNFFAVPLRILKQVMEEGTSGLGYRMYRNLLADVNVVSQSQSFLLQNADRSGFIEELYAHLDKKRCPMDRATLAYAVELSLLLSVKGITLYYNGESDQEEILKTAARELEIVERGALSPVREEKQQKEERYI